MKWTIFGILLLAGMLSAVVNIPVGECETRELFNSTDNSTFNETFCAEIPNLGINIVLNASDSSNNHYVNSTFGIDVFAGGNQTVVVQNVTNVQQCNATSVTLWANSTFVVNNVAIACLANSTTVIVNNTVSGACNFAANVTCSDSEQRIQNVSGLDIRIFPPPSNYCYENINVNPMNPAQIVHSAKCNITAVAPPNYTNVMPVSCPTGQYCQEPRAECQVCPEAPPKDCSAEVAQAKLDCTENQVIPLKDELSSFKLTSAGTAAVAAAGANLSQIASKAGREAASEGNDVLPYFLAFVVVVLLLKLVQVFLKIRDENRGKRSSSTSVGMSKEQKALFADAGTEDNVWAAKKKTSGVG